MPQKMGCATLTNAVARKVKALTCFGLGPVTEAVKMRLRFLQSLKMSFTASQYTCSPPPYQVLSPSNFETT